MRTLVTGAGGFVGQWVCRALLARGRRVYGTILAEPAPQGALGADERGKVHWLAGDLRAPGVVDDMLDVAKPEVIIHLAGLAYPPQAQADPAAAVEANVALAVRLLHAVSLRRRVAGFDPVVLIAGSAEQYGAQPAGVRIPETAERRPLSVYAATKLAQEAIAFAYHRGEGMRVLCTRAFNHSGPGQRPPFFLPSLVERARAAKGGTVSIGNTEPVRDFLHVADVAEAYVLLAEQGRAGTAYNVCSGEGISIGDLAREVVAAAGGGTLVADESLRRAVDVPWLVGDHAALVRDTGWQPRHTRAQLIADLLDAPSH